MNKLPLLTLNLQTAGLRYKIDLDLPILLPRLKEICGMDLQPIIIPLLVKFIRSQIKRLEKTQELGCLTDNDKLELVKLRIDENNLATLLKETSHE